MGPAMGSLLYCKPEFITKQLGNDERMIQCVDTINIWETPSLKIVERVI